MMDATLLDLTPLFCARPDPIVLREANPLITDHPLYLALAAGVEARRAAYRELFRAHLDEAVIADIRKALNRGQPLGNERFREQVEVALGRRLSPKRKGRVRKVGGAGEDDQMNPFM